MEKSEGTSWIGLRNEDLCLQNPEAPIPFRILWAESLRSSVDFRQRTSQVALAYFL